MENSTLIYLVKTSVALVLCLGLYLLLFRRDTFLLTKRIYLLASLLFSALVPFITVHFATDEKPRIPTSWLSEVVVVPFSNQNLATTKAFDWQSMVVGSLLAVSCIFLIRFGLQLFEIFSLKYRNLSRKSENCTLVQISENKISPFSFFKWIFVGKNGWEQGVESEILRHEMVHVKQWHSVDVMLSEIFCIVFWWNPAVWLYRREIRINHEYLADRGVLRMGHNPQQYQYLLLQTLTITNRIPINNHFNISQLKQRIAMMNKKQSPWLSATKYLLLVPFVGLLIAGNAAKASHVKILNEITDNAAIGKSTPNPQAQDEKIPTKNILEQAETAGSSDSKSTSYQEDNASLSEQQKESKKTKAFMMVEQMPQFQGGEKALMDYLSKSIHYPEAAAKNGIQGRVIIRFIVDEAGGVTDVEAIKGLDPACDQEAIRVVKAMPKWIPGKQNGEAVPVYYVLPIAFSLQGEKESKPDYKNLLIIVDGHEISQEEFKKIDPATIQSVNVLKSKSAIEVYGEKVKNKDGAIVIQLKKEN